MTLRTKTLTLIGVTLVILIVALYIALSSILSNSFAALEAREIKTELDAVTTYLQAESRSLHNHLGDWANWDDTFEFVQDYTDTFVSENFSGNAFATLEINIMLFLNRDDALVYAAGVEPDGELMATRRLAGFYDRIMDYREQTFVPSFNGFLTLGEEVLMVAGRPIYGNDGVGASAGTLIWIRILDPAKIARYGEALAHHFILVAAQPHTLPVDFHLVVAQLATLDHVIDTRNAETAYGYTRLSGLDDEAGALLRVEIGREAYREGQQSIVYYLVTLLIVGMILIGCVLFVIEYYVLIPVWRLSADVRSIAVTGDFGRRLPVRGSDELTDLTRGINTMLQAVDSSAEALRRLNMELETRVAARTAELAETNRELAGLQAQKDVFFARASHELRTPLTNIITRLYLLEKQPEQFQTHLNVLRVVSSYMRELINDILEISRLQRGSITLNRSRVSLQAVVKSVLDIQRAEAERKAITLRTVLPAESIDVSADARRLTQIVTNLLVNAINYTTAPGEIVVEVGVSADQRALLRVRDTGLGIAPEHLAHVFDPFFRAREEISVGTGLGLLIVRELVKLHDGEVTVESQLGVGSTFTVLFPLMAAQSNTPLLAAPALPSISG